MSWMIYVALLGFIPFTLLIFSLIPPRRAVLLLLLTGWLFLPMAALKLPGIPAFSKISVVGGAILLGAIIFDFRKFRTLRFRWFDWPVVILCVCSLASSISMGLGAYDGISTVVSKFFMWGTAYLLGRLYFADAEGLKELALGMVAGGLIYVPLCLFEIKMSPILTTWLYGLSTGYFQTIRYGGWRPVVFMQHGLAVGVWMMTASLIASWFWMTGSAKKLWLIPMGWVAVTLLVTTILCKSTGAIVLLGLGLVALAIIRYGKSVIVWGLIALCPLYMAARMSQYLRAGPVLEWVSFMADEKRTGSVNARLVQEDIFTSKALQRPVFGWTGWYFFPTDENGEKMTRGVDSLWVITLGCNGITGLTALVVTLLMPPVLYMSRSRKRDWSRPETAAVVVLSLVLVLHMVDNLQNGMLNILFVAAIGGLTAYSASNLHSPSTASAIGDKQPPMQRR